MGQTPDTLVRWLKAAHQAIEIFHFEEVGSSGQEVARFDKGSFSDFFLFWAKKCNNKEEDFKGWVGDLKNGVRIDIHVAEVDNFLHEVDKVIEEGSLVDDDLISNFPAISFSDILLVYLS